MPYPFYSCFIVILLLILQSYSVWATDEHTQVDQIFAKFDSGTTMTREQILQDIAQLDTLIATDDVIRNEKRQLIKCWNQGAETDAEILQAQLTATQMLEQVPSNASQHYMTDLNLCRAWYLQLSDDITGAMEGYNHSVKTAYLHEDLKLIADSLSLRGALYSHIGDFSSALEDLITAQDLYESLDLHGWANVNLADVATSLRRYGDPQGAIRYYNKLKQLYLENHELMQAMLVTSDIGLALEELGEHPQALEHFLLSYHYFKEHKHNRYAAVGATNIASSLLKLKRVAEAEHYLHEAAQIIKEQDHADYGFMQLFMAEAKYLQQQFPEALMHLQLAEAVFRQMQHDRGLILSLQLKNDIYAAMEDWARAHQALQEYVKITKKIDNNTLSQQTTAMRVKFDSQRIESENKRLIENQKLKDQEVTLLNKNKSLQYIILLLAGFILAIVSIYAYKQVHKNRQLQILALTDSLTQLPNRRHIYAKGKAYFQQALKQQSPFSVIIFDADYFKRINDNFGHEIGDNALIVIAKASRRLMGNKDIVGRIGGEEFLILLPEADIATARDLAHQLQTRIRTLAEQALPTTLELTVSIGIASLTLTGQTDDNSDQDKTFTNLLKRADDALYEAKNAGRNCVKVAS